MASFNQITIVGNAGKDAELSYYADGKPMCKFSVGVSKGRDKGSDWFNVVVFGKSAEWAARDIVKGSRVMVIGPHQSNKGNDGKTYWSVLGNSVTVLDKKGKPKSDGWDDISKEIRIEIDDDNDPF